jgi:hypothetical protein
MSLDLNIVADTAVTDLQNAIDVLTARRGRRDVDEDEIDAKVEALQAKQTEVRDLTLARIVESPENQAAIAALNAAAARLTKTAGEMAAVAAILDKASDTVDAATSVVSAIGNLKV